MAPPGLNPPHPLWVAVVWERPRGTTSCMDELLAEFWCSGADLTAAAAQGGEPFLDGPFTFTLFT